MAAWLSALGALGGANDKEESDPDKKKVGILLGEVTGANAYLTNQAKAKRQRGEKELRDELQNEAVYTSKAAQRGYESAQDLVPEMTGRLNSEYVTPDMLTLDKVEELGGEAFKGLSDLAGGYNPVINDNPRMQVLQADRDFMSKLKKDAQAKTEATVSGWEEAMANLGDQYNEAGDKLAAERDEMRDTYKTEVEENRAARDADIPQQLVDAWIKSIEAGATKDIDALNKYGGFRNNRYYGADTAAKQRLIESLLAEGYSYADIVADPTFRSWLKADVNTNGLYSSWDKEGLPESGKDLALELRAGRL